MIALILLSGLFTQAELTGKTIHVTDGDTITVLVDKREVKIRLAGIDAPESKQPYGDEAKQALKEMTHGKQVTVSTTNKDKYGRTIGVIAVDGINVNERLVEMGIAWHYVRFSTSEQLAKLEKEARDAKCGLWADQNMPIPPWEWRKRKQAR